MDTGISEGSRKPRVKGRNDQLQRKGEGGARGGLISMQKDQEIEDKKKTKEMKKIGRGCQNHQNGLEQQRLC